MVYLLHMKGDYMKYTIFCFSGTGNSLYVAQGLSDYLGDCTLQSFTSDSLPKEIEGKNHSVGFVFPSYYGNLPRIVKNKLEEIKISPDTWIFSVVTMGAVGQGSVAALKKVLVEKGNTLSYGCGIKMPANYVMSYNPATMEKGEVLNKKANEQIKQIGNDIQMQKNKIRSNFITSSNLYKDVPALDKKFTVDSACIHCGICQKVCPVENIDFSEKIPQWKGHCEHCTACINWCPKSAIQYGGKTENRRRYLNPAISLNQFLAFEESNEV